MFVQVVQGRVADAGRMRAALDEWMTEIAPGAKGWLGTTAGVTDDGRFLAVIRFDSPEAGVRNGERPEVDKWWGRTAALLTDGPEMRQSDEVDVDVVGNPDEAGFVQVIQGRVSDPERGRQLMNSDSEEWARFRPDVLGSLTAQHEEGAHTVVLYFRSEEEAREGERKEPPPALQAQMAEMDAMTIGEPEFFDLRQPWFFAPRP